MSETKMKATVVTPGIFRLSTNIHDILFEGIWPIPNGVSLSSYIVKGDKVAIVDGFCGWDGVPETLLAQLAELDIQLEAIDYVVINHMEPDHSGWLEAFRALRPEFTIVTSAKAVPLLEAFYRLGNQKIKVVGDGDTLDLGQGHVLAFAEIPNVHWPETIATFDTKTGTLMPCDAFGSFGTTEGAPYDDELAPDQIKSFEREAVRYYSNIVAAFSQPTGKAIDKVEKVLGDKVKIIAPAHGVVWRKNPGKIIADYKRYVSYQKGPAKAEVTVIWGSMYGNTAGAIPTVIKTLKESGLRWREFQVPRDNIGDILAACWTSTGIVLAMPTYEYKMFPPMAAVIDELGRKKVANRHVFRLGSYGWSGGAQGELDELMKRHKTGWSFVPPVEFKGKPTAADLALVEKRVRGLAARVHYAILKADERR
jgi:anaerobic nitric oxide reductase flavorubredoxin